MSLQRLSLFSPILALGAAALAPALAHAQTGLTPVRVFVDAAPSMKLLMLALIVAMVAAIVITVRKVMSGPHLAGGSTFLSGLRLGGPLIGLLGAAYNGLNMALGVANVNPPSLRVLAPGIAEGMTSLMLGLIVGVVAVICHWIVEARIDRAVLSA
jgi:hypothetical protein